MTTAVEQTIDLRCSACGGLIKLHVTTARPGYASRRIAELERRIESLRQELREEREADVWRRRFFDLLKRRAVYPRDEE